jgi:hypothetical protein
MEQISSPPIFFSEAFFPVVTPSEVDRMIVPYPFRTRGSFLCPE